MFWWGDCPIVPLKYTSNVQLKAVKIRGINWGVRPVRVYSCLPIFVHTYLARIIWYTIALIFKLFLSILMKILLNSVSSEKYFLNDFWHKYETKSHKMINYLITILNIFISLLHPVTGPPYSVECENYFKMALLRSKLVCNKCSLLKHWKIPYMWLEHFVRSLLSDRFLAMFCYSLELPCITLLYRLCFYWSVR